MAIAIAAHMQRNNLQTRVVLLVESGLRVVVPVRASLFVLALRRERDLVGRLDELHAETFADVPCDVAVETFRCVSNLVCFDRSIVSTYSQAPGLFEGKAIAIQPPPGSVAVSRRGGVAQFMTAVLGSYVPRPWPMTK